MAEVALRNVVKRFDNVEVVRSMPGYVEQATVFLTALQANANDWLTSHGSPVLVDVKSALNPAELSRREAGCRRARKPALGYPFERSWPALPASNPSSTGPSRIAREKLAPDVRTPEKDHGGDAITGKASSRETVVLRLDGYPRSDVYASEF